MQRPLLLLAALAAIVALFAVRLAPASVADARLAAMTKGGVHLTDAEGTLWAGRGILTAGATRIPVAWRIDAWPLLRSELHLHFIRGEGGTAGAPRADIAIGRNYMGFRDVEATFPAAFLGAAAGSGASWPVGGDVEISTALVEWAPPANRGDARIRWRAARLNAPGSVEPLELGDITAELSSAGERLAGPVSNAGGDLGVRGNLAFGANSGIALSLVLTPRSEGNRELARALSLLGPREGDGWRVEWRIPLR